MFSVLPVVLVGIGGDWGSPWDALPDGLRQIIGSAEIAALLFGLGAISLAREPDGVLTQTTRGLRDRRLARAARERDRVGGSPESSDEAPDRESLPPQARATPVTSVPKEAARKAAAPGEVPILELREVCAGYGEVEVLHGLSLQVAAGEVVAVLGANGAGKSTLCGVIAGTVGTRSGRVIFEGTDVTDMAVHLRARRGMLLAPEARGIFPGLSVDDNLAVRLRTETARRQAQQRFPILADRHNQTAELLSGGEQQQLAMAVALADPPGLFLADEPSLGLSPMATISVFEALAEMNDRGTALILVEEQAGSALELADRVVIMDLGRITWSGPADEVDLDRLQEAYLGR
ncbi:MAG: ABC transporter ATP-binding protein [Microthrixaceae bacterium]|nr:ABC transporter ATP-binding protein [Microthrixaceae bacterium]